MSNKRLSRKAPKGAGVLQLRDNEGEHLRAALNHSGDERGERMLEGGQSTSPHV